MWYLTSLCYTGWGAVTSLFENEVKPVKTLHNSLFLFYGCHTTWEIYFYTVLKTISFKCPPPWAIDWFRRFRKLWSTLSSIGKNIFFFLFFSMFQCSDFDKNRFRSWNTWDNKGVEIWKRKSKIENRRRRFRKAIASRNLRLRFSIFDFRFHIFTVTQF